MMKAYKASIESFIVALGVGIPTGWLSDLFGVVVVAVFSFFILPLIQMLANKFFDWLKKKGLPDDIVDKVKQEIYKQAIKKLEQAIVEAKKKNDTVALTILEGELKKLIDEHKEE